MGGFDQLKRNRMKAMIAKVNSCRGKKMKKLDLKSWAVFEWGLKAETVFEYIRDIVGAKQLKEVRKDEGYELHG